MTSRPAQTAPGSNTFVRKSAGTVAVHPTFASARRTLRSLPSLVMTYTDSASAPRSWAASAAGQVHLAVRGWA
ncbi:hypothetical protein AB0I51_09770 [Streptomyces sp. NPDC050549]|uniref:hypothetical protein n=1 Tax=Streptomyces sp. NPDC050549 TaxID=3155406 RepID=UPI00341F7359